MGEHHEGDGHLYQTLVSRLPMTIWYWRSVSYRSKFTV